MPHLEWVLQVDWDGDGDFGSASEPGDIHAIRFRRGRAARVRADGRGQEQPDSENFRIEVRDPSARYDAFNPQSPLYSSLGGSGQALRLLLGPAGGPAQTVFTGVLRSVDYLQAAHMAVLSGEGLARWLMSGPAEALWTDCQPPLPGFTWDPCFTPDGSTPFPVNYWRGRPGGLPLSVCAGLTLARAGWPFGMLTTQDAPGPEEPEFFYFDGSSAWRTLEELADAFAARLFLLRDGRLFVMDRRDVTGLEAGACAPGTALAARGLERQNAAVSLRNSIKVNVRPHTARPFKAPYLAEYYLEAWSNPGPLAVAPLTTLEIDVKYPGGAGSAGVGSFVDVNGSGYPVNYECWSAADRSGVRMDAAGTGDGEFAILWENRGADTVPYGNNQQWTRVRFRNFSASLTAHFFDARVMLIGIREPGQPVVCQAVDEQSVELNGVRGLEINSRWIQTVPVGAEIAQTYVQALSARQQAAPARLTCQWGGDELARNLLNYDLGTHVNFGPQGGGIALANFGMCGRWLVVGQELEWLSAAGQQAVVKLTYEKAADLVAVVHERSSAVTSGVTPAAALNTSHQVDAHPGRLLLAVVGLRASRSVSAVTFGSQVFTRLAACQAGPGDNPRAELWVLRDPAVGIDTVSVSLGGADLFEMAVLGFHHAHSAIPLSQALSAAGAGGPAGLGVDAQEGDLVVDGLCYSGADALPGAGQTLLGMLTSDGNWKLAVSRQPGSQGGAMDWTLTPAWAQVAVAVRAASGRAGD